jgi:RNA polymerase sigma factor (sigma-70 family)
VEASTLTHAQRRRLFARRSPLLKFQGDESLVALTRDGNQSAFEALVTRYQSRLLGFCRQMLGSTEDAEDVLQEVFVASYKAMCADDRPIAVRPWLYRIARNRCLNHLRKPTADGQDTMDTHPHMNGVTTLERVQSREDFRSLLDDVGRLPETQRTALLLREIDAMSYEEIAHAMDTTVPGVKSLLVRARIALAESSQARALTCDDVRLQLAEAAEGLAKLDGAARRHIKACEPCAEFRKQLRNDSKVLSALFPAGPLLVLKGFVIGKLSGLFGGGGGAAAGAGGGGAGAAGAGAAGAGAAGAAAAGAGGTAAGGAAIGGAAAVGGGAAAGGAGAATAAGAAAGAIGTKAAAGLATAAIVAGGVAEYKHIKTEPTPKASQSKAAKPDPAPAPGEVATAIVAAPAAPAATAPATAAPSEEVVSEPAVPAEDDETLPGEEGIATGGVLADSKRKRKHNAQADVNTAPRAPTAPVATGITPACDANGDGVVDEGAGAECYGTGVATQVAPAEVTPPPTVPQPKQESQPKKKSGAKKKSRAKKKPGARKGRKAKR